MVRCADDAGYDASRAIWNGMLDRKPTIVARCAEMRDIANAVNFARGNRVLLSVKGGGHNSAATAAPFWATSTLKPSSTGWRFQRESSLTPVSAD
jgi:hypothetical protein